MRILYHHRILARDGMRVHIDEIVRSLKARRHDVVLTGPDDEAGALPAKAGRPGFTERLSAIRKHLPAAVGESMEWAYNLKAYGALRRAAARTRPDFLYERCNSFLLAGLWLKRSFGLPMLVEVNAPLTDERLANGQLSLVGLARRCERAVWQGADAVLPVSDALADYVRAAGVPEERIHVVPNGVRMANFPPAPRRDVRAEFGLESKIVFGFVGFVRTWHGLDRVIDAFAELDDPRLHLLVVGDGPACPALKAQAAGTGLTERLTFAGARPHEEIPDYLAACDVALQPDVTAYASPLKLFEYMAAGCAVIAPDRPNIREIVRNGETALLVPPDAPDALGRAIAALARDDGMRARLGRAARAEISDRDYSWDGNARRIETIAEALLSAPRAGAAAPAS